MRRFAAPRKWSSPARQAGASARQFAAAVLAAALEQASANSRGALESTDPGYIHQVRVGLRRYRSALRLFRELLRTPVRKRLARRARKAMRPLGTVRDWDVGIEWLRGAKAPQQVVRRANQRREAAAAALGPIELASLRIEHSAWKSDGGPIDAFGARALARLRRKLAQRGRKLDWDDAAQRHRTRIAVKRLRYAADLLGADARALRRLQDSLGGLNDCAVIRRFVAQLGAPAGLESKLAADERRLLRLARRQLAALELED
jgi:CHAD domain-containing protein